MEICEFVSFSIAKKLKEKGFKEKCIATYDIEDGEFDFNNYVIRVAYKMNVTTKDCLQLFNNTNTGLIAAPTISQVLRWLRKEKKMHIMMATYSHYPNNIHDLGYEIINLQTYTCEHYSCRFDCYEAAAIAGIEYVIDNLI